MSTNHAAKIDERISLIMAELFTFLLSSVYYGVLRVAGKDPGCVLAWPYRPSRQRDYCKICNSLTIPISFSLAAHGSET